MDEPKVGAKPDCRMGGPKWVLDGNAGCEGCASAFSVGCKMPLRLWNLLLSVAIQLPQGTPIDHFGTLKALLKCGGTPHPHTTPLVAFVLNDT